MIQRIQSIYLSLTILISFIFLKGSFLSFINNSGSVIKVTFRGIIKVTDVQGQELIEKFLALPAIIILIPAISLITIFLFKNRRIQLWFALTGIILAVSFILISSYISCLVAAKYDAKLIPGFMMISPVLILILEVLAYRGIRKDDRLVKSYDRLR